MSSQACYIHVKEIDKDFYSQYNNYNDKVYSKLYESVDDLEEEFLGDAEKVVTCTCGNPSTEGELYPYLSDVRGHDPYREVQVCVTCRCVVEPSDVVVGIGT